MYKKIIVIALEVMIIIISYIWIRFTYVGFDFLSTSVYFIASLALLFFTLHTLNVDKWSTKLGIATLLVVIIIGTIETMALLQENRVRREYPEPCSFLESPQIPRFKNFGIIVMQCRKDGIWGARTD